jgi:hypothetical protein
VPAGREGNVDLRFSPSGDPDSERFYRTHFVSPALSGRALEKLEQKLSEPPRPVVFEIIRDSGCTECGVELPKGRMLFLESEKALCLACAGMGELEFLQAGDTALTRRATKYSGNTAVVVRFSRSRGRYERQGILVEPAAIERAESECTLDADARAKARARAAKVRGKQDEELVEQMTGRILALFPAARRGKRGPSPHTPPREAADAWAEARLDAIWKSGPYSWRSPPLSATTIRTTIHSGRAVWITRTPVNASGTRCGRSWRGGRVHLMPAPSEVRSGARGPGARHKSGASKTPIRAATVRER